MMNKDIENKSDMSWDEYERWRAQMIVNNSIQENGYMSDDKMKLFMNLATTILMSMLFGGVFISLSGIDVLVMAFWMIPIVLVMRIYTIMKW